MTNLLQETNMENQVRYRDLSEERQQSILSDSITIYEMVQEDILNTLKEELESYGFNEPEIRYTGFSSQGDGASFTSTVIDFDTFFDKERKNMDFTFSGDSFIDCSEEDKELIEGMGVTEIFLIKELMTRGFWTGNVSANSSPYSHERSVDLSMEVEMHEEVEASEVNFDAYEITELNADEMRSFNEYLELYLKTWIIDKCKDMYSRIEKDYNSFVTEQEKQLLEGTELFTP